MSYDYVPGGTRPTAAEIPLGILTALIGAPFFAYLLRQTKGGWG